MKRLNNKGMTLTELLVSIALLSIVMIFAYGIVNQLVYTKNNNIMATDNQINRALIIDTIQNDLVIYGLAYENIDGLLGGFSVEKNGDEVIFTMTTYKGKSYIILTERTLTYTDFTGKANKWTFNKAFTTLKSESNLTDYYTFSYDDNSSTALIKIDIPIYTNNNANNGNPNNNINDDISIMYYGPYLRLDDI